MNTDIDTLTEAVLGCAFTVSNELGAGFLEKVYENALALELRGAGLEFQQQSPVPVRYRGAVVGEYVADMVVEDRVLVELKAAKGISEIHQAQCLNYLKATGLPVCLLLNFGTPRIGVKRFVL